MSSQGEGMSHNRKTAFSEAVLRAFFGGQFTLPPSLESAFAALALGDSDPTAHKPTTLLDLPAELKLEIFDYLLRPGDVYIRWNARAAHHDIRFAHILEDWDSNPAPTAWLPTLRPRSPQPTAKPNCS